MAFVAMKWFLIISIIIALQAVTTSSGTSSPSPSTSKITPVTKKSSKASIPTVVTPTNKPTNGNVSSEVSNFDDLNVTPSLKDNKGLLKRMLYVAIGFSVIVALYFIVKTIRTKARKSKSKKYGMIYSSGDVEMQPLDKEDDDEDDMTVFDRKIRK